MCSNEVFFLANIFFLQGFFPFAKGFNEILQLEHRALRSNTHGANVRVPGSAHITYCLHIIGFNPASREHVTETTGLDRTIVRQEPILLLFSDNFGWIDAHGQSYRTDHSRYSKEMSPLGLISVSSLLAFASRTWSANIPAKGKKTYSRVMN